MSCSRLIHLIVIVLFAQGFALSSVAFDRPLSDKALFYRCYSKLTGKRPAKNNPLLTQVLSGGLAPIDACEKLLNNASLRTNGQLNQSTNQVAKDVLAYMHRVHVNFIEKRTVSSNAFCIGNSTMDLYDPTEPAMHFTRAFLRQDLNFDSVFSGNQALQGLRSEQVPAAGAASNRGLMFEGTSRYSYGTTASSNPSLNFVPWLNPPIESRGELLGIKTRAPYNINRTAVGGLRNQNIFVNTGGGVLGSSTYFINNETFAGAVGTNGATIIHRRWTNAVLKDFLCRDLPAVRAMDVGQFIEPTSSLTFRRENSCNQCHATMDRLAGTVRNRTFAIAHNQNCNAFRLSRPYFPLLHQNTVAQNNPKWMAEPDANYFKRPAKGVLYFRSYDGSLINKSFTGTAGLANVLKQTNDLYVCAASKYYYHLTGIRVNLSDLHDPQSPTELNEQELKYRNLVINLGLKLKKHKDPTQLLIDIMKQKEFQHSNYLQQVRELNE